MLTLYFRRFACSLACQIGLLEAEQQAQYLAVDLPAKRTSDGQDYFSINGKGKVPTLALHDGSLTFYRP